jgi:hypothetical protein
MWFTLAAEPSAPSAAESGALRVISGFMIAPILRNEN